MFYIVYPNYLTKDAQQMNVGGIETYIQNLSDVIMSIGEDITVLQISNFDFKKQFNGVNVWGFKYYNSKAQKIGRFLVSKIPLAQKDVIIFGSEEYSVKTKNRSICIQHGIYWDKPSYKVHLIEHIKHLIKCYRTKMWLSNSDCLVCVDYNFPNWYRATFGTPDFRFVTIPNFAKVQQEFVKTNDTVKIIFARRFYLYRGTRVFAQAIKELFKVRKNVFVTFAGEGPDKDYLQKQFAGNPNVEFISYESCDSYKIHKDKDIAVVPTIGSEGTSLSLLEAMASNCACICTDIGGMTNIVLNNFNGLVVPASDSQELLNALLRLVDDKNLRAEIAANGLNTVASSFSFELWKERWTAILSKYASELP